MKIYMSYWSGGYQKTPSEFVVNLHKLSAYYVKKNYGEVTLITDSKSKPFFETNNLFNNITTDLDVLKDVQNDNWALGKLYAYKWIAEKREPFLHVDYDVLLMKPLEKEYENKAVLVQNEEANAYHVYKLAKFYSLLGEQKYDFDSVDETHKAYNMGIFGGTDYDFITYYANNAINFCTSSEAQRIFPIIKAERSWIPATISEQYYLWLLAKKRGIEVTSYLSNDDSTNKNIKLADEDAVKKGYVHIQGYKKYPVVQSKINQQLRELSLL